MLSSIIVFLSNGILAREKYRAFLFISLTTLTALGLNTSSRSSIATLNVAIGAVESLNSAATWDTFSGASSGSSPCTLTTIVLLSSLSKSTTSANRSVPDW